jgi:uncharacterized membrane protein
MKKNKLHRKTQAWITADIITPEQAQAILQHELSHITASSQRKILTAFAIIGGALVLCGIILLIGSNWDVIPDPIKLLLLLAALAGTYLGAMEADRRSLHNAWRELLWLAAGILPLIILALISQMFHVIGNPFYLFITWLALLIPVLILNQSLSTWILTIIASTLTFHYLILPKDLFRLTNYFLYFIAYGLLFYFLSNGWLLKAHHRRYTTGTYFGLLITLSSLYLYGFTVHFWPLTGLLLFTISVFLIHFGFKNQRPAYVRTAYLFIILLILTFYIRLFGTLFDTGLIFIGAGGIIITLVWLYMRLNKSLPLRYSSPLKTTSNPDSTSSPSSHEN